LVEVVSQVHIRESLVSCVTHIFHCSHLIAVYLDIRPILDGDSAAAPLQSEMWHPIAKPHYRLPTELPPLIETLRQVESAEQIQKDDWTLGELHKLREACELAIQHGFALVVFLSNTLSKPPMPKKA